jgi:hypothetical protein
MIGSQRAKELETAIASAMRGPDARLTRRAVPRWCQRDCGIAMPHQRSGFDSVAGYLWGLDAGERPKLNATI